MTGCSSPMRSDHGDVVMMDTDSSAAFSPMPIRSRSCTPSRTSKRFRNGRPSDQEVHRELLASFRPHLNFMPTEGRHIACVISCSPCRPSLQRTRSRCSTKPSNSILNHTTYSPHLSQPHQCPLCRHHKLRQPTISRHCIAFGSCPRPFSPTRQLHPRPQQPRRPTEPPSARIVALVLVKRTP